MRYLLVNHVPFARGSHRAAYLIGDLWLEDLRAQARAIADIGGKLVVATPLVSSEVLAGTASGSFNHVEVVPDREGFEYAPIPRYLSMRQYVSVRRALRRRIAKLVTSADVVQMDYGGHPIGLGRVVWPIATAAGKTRVWLFDGADPFPRLRLEADQARNPLKRWGKRRYVDGFERFCRHAVGTADLVFAHNAAVVERFRDVWGPHGHAFDRSFVTDDILLNDHDWPARRARLRDTRRPLRVMACGRQILIKGTDQVIRAVAKCRRLGVPVELDVLGDGADLDAFRALAKESNVADAVRFRGTVPFGRPLFDAWADCDLIAVTNLTAEISRNVLLAGARGLPLVTYRNPGTDKMLTDADAAVIVPRGDVDALAEAFLSLHRDRDRLVRLAENGHQLASGKTLDATHRRRAELVAKVLKIPVGGGPSPSPAVVTV